jgi:RAI1 like PD-(D/E)XK nuclease
MRWTRPYPPRTYLWNSQHLSCTALRSKQRLPAMSATKDADSVFVFEMNVRQWLGSETARAASIHVSEPYEVGCFSRRADRTVAYGSREQLRRFQEPRISSNLAAGIHRFRAKNESESDLGVETVLTALQHCGFDIEHLADVVTYRNNLNKIALTPYNTRDAWEFDAVIVRNTVFLNIRKLDEPIPGARHQQFMYMGYKFEALCTGSESKPVDANEEFCACIRLRVGNNRILLAAEMDAELPTESAHAKQKAYVELKTMKKPASDRDYMTMYSSRYLKWFVQSYLGGVRTMFIGLRDDKGTLVAVDHISTRSLPRSAREGLQRYGRAEAERKTWDPNVCVSFLDYVIDVVRRSCSSHLGKTVRFSYAPVVRTVTAKVVDDSKSSASLAETLEAAWSRL